MIWEQWHVSEGGVRGHCSAHKCVVSKLQHSLRLWAWEEKMECNGRMQKGEQHLFPKENVSVVLCDEPQCWLLNPSEKLGQGICKVSPVII